MCFKCGTQPNWRKRSGGTPPYFTAFVSHMSPVVQQVWAMACVVVTHDFACLIPNSSASIPFELPPQTVDTAVPSLDASPPEPLNDPMPVLVSPLMDISRHLDINGVGKRAGQISVQVCNIVVTLSVPLCVTLFVADLVCAQSACGEAFQSCVCDRSPWLSRDTGAVAPFQIWRRGEPLEGGVSVCVFAYARYAQ